MLSVFISLYFSMKTFFLSKKHLFMMLLSLEFSMLTLIMILLNFLIFFMHDLYVIAYFIVFMVCEAVLGLVLLTLIVRSYGNDYLKGVSLMGC